MRAPSRLLHGAFSLAALAFAGWVAWGVLSWAVLDARFAGTAQACRGVEGACWSVIAARYRLILFGLYPFDEQWRAALACVVVVATVVMGCMPAMWTARRAAALWLGGYGLFILLMRGGVFGLPAVTTEQWGGLALTLFIYVTVIVFGMPIAIGIALLRQDGYPAFRWLAALVVDLTRALPLVTILFAAALLLPLVLPQALTGDKLTRALAGFAFFFGCYQSEVIRGGLQAVPPGVREAGLSLGLDYLKVMRLIVLPIAFRVSMPATINQFVVTFKETSLVVIIGLYDLMTSAGAAYQTLPWTPYYKEVYVLVGGIYFTVAFSLSRYGAAVERRFAQGAAS